MVTIYKKSIRQLGRPCELIVPSLTGKDTSAAWNELLSHTTRLRDCKKK